MLQLYEANELTFEANGETLPEAFNAKLTHYLNGEYSLEFYLKQSDQKAKQVEVDKIVFAEGQPFRIVMIAPGVKDIRVYAVHVFFDLRDYQVEAVNCEQTNGYTVMQAIFSGAGTNFTYSSDITKLSTMNEEKKNIVEMLQIATERYEGELVRNKFDVRLNNRVGVDTEHIVYVDKNVATAIKEVDVKDVCTRAIIEYGSHDEPKRVIVTSENINLYSHPKTRRYQNITDDIQTEQQAIDWGLGKFKGINRIDVPKVAVEIDLLLDDSFKELGIGDTVICKIPKLFLDERVKVIGYESDPLKNKKTKLYIGYKAKGLGGSIIGGAVEAIRPEIADVDKDLQAKIDAANAAIDKEYNDRVQAVTDAIAKAEADVEKAKEELNQELGQAMTDWDTEFEEAKTNIDNSIGNVEKILGDRITANTSEITVAKDKISMVISNGSTASAVQLTPNAMKFISEEINLFGNVIFNSLVDESTTEILGDKIKTGTIKTSTLLVDKEILVDGTVKAQHFVGGTAELAEITTILFKTEVLQTAWADIGEAFVTKLTADDALLLKLTAKDAFITSVQSIDFQAERIVGGRLRSKNGLLEWNLNDSYLKFTGPSNAMEYTNSGSSAGISFGEVYSSVAGRNVPTVSLYGNQGTNAASNIGLDIMSGEQQINIRADRISFYDHENSTTHGFHINTTAGDAWNTSIEPWSAGYGEVGKSTKGFYSVNCLTIRRQNEATYSNCDMKENIREIPDIVVREVFNTLKVKEYYYKDETFAYSRDKIKVGLIIEDIAPEGNSEYLLSDGGNFLKSDNVAFMNVRMTQILNAELNEALEMIVDLQQQINELKGA